MTYTPAFVGTIHDGVLRPDDPARWRRHVNSLNGQRVRVSVAKASTARSISANNYLWGVVYGAIADWSGHDDNELHAIFKAMFLPSHTVSMNGQVLSIQGSTSALTSDGFSTYVDKVKRWAAEQGVHVPEPNEVG